MRKRTALFVSALLLLLTGCAQTQTQTQTQVHMQTRQTDKYFSTVSILALYVEEGEETAFEQTWAQVKALLAEVERAVSVSDPESDISRFNALTCGDEIPVSSLTAELLHIAFEAYEATDGLYDPTVYPLVDLWGFSPRFNRNTYRPMLPYDRAYSDDQLPLPQEEHIQSLLPLVGLKGVVLSERDGQFYLRKETSSVEIDGEVIDAQIDLGGIAKGYVCDLVIDLLRKNGYSQGRFICGGSSLAVMSRPTDGGMYELKIGKPRLNADTNTHYATLRVRDVGISTSMDISRSFVLDGVTYCHVIDPRTGWPINMPGTDGVQSGLAGATLLGESAAMCDAITTALLVMGPDRAEEFLADTGETHAVLVAFRDDKDTLEVLCDTTALDITLTDPQYILAP